MIRLTPLVNCPPKFNHIKVADPAPFRDDLSKFKPDKYGSKKPATTPVGDPKDVKWPDLGSLK